MNLDKSEKISGYAHPEAIVSTQWVADHIADKNLRLVESKEDILLYDTGHIPTAIQLDWHTEPNHPLRRDYLVPDQFAALRSQKGID